MQVVGMAAVCAMAIMWGGFVQDGESPAVVADTVYCARGPEVGRALYDVSEHRWKTVAVDISVAGDQGPTCSATTAACSTANVAGNSPKCSVIDGTGPGLLQCSVLSGAGAGVWCSVDASEQRFAPFCSVTEPSGSADWGTQCSVIGGGGNHQCSVIGGNFGGFCSVSALTKGSFCSVTEDKNGNICSVTNVAPNGICSTFDPKAGCSVMAGTSTAKCTANLLETGKMACSTLGSPPYGLCSTINGAEVTPPNDAGWCFAKR